MDGRNYETRHKEAARTDLPTADTQRSTMTASDAMWRDTKTLRSSKSEIRVVRKPKTSAGSSSLAAYFSPEPQNPEVVMWKKQEASETELSTTAKQALIALYKAEHERIAFELEYQKQLNVFLQTQSRMTTKGLMLNGSTDKQEVKLAVLSLIEINAALLESIRGFLPKKRIFAEKLSKSTTAQSSELSLKKIEQLTDQVESCKLLIVKRQGLAESSLRQTSETLSRSQSSYTLKSSKSVRSGQMVHQQPLELPNPLKNQGGLQRTRSSQVLLAPMGLQASFQGLSTSSSSSGLLLSSHDASTNSLSSTSFRTNSSSSPVSNHYTALESSRQSRTALRPSATHTSDKSKDKPEDKPEDHKTPMDWKKKTAKYPKLEILCHDYSAKKPSAK